MSKFSLSAIAISLIATSAFAEPHEERSSSHCVPPLPMLNPTSQVDYEKTLSPFECNWVRSTQSHFNQFVRLHPSDLRNIRCGFAVDSNGKIKGPITFYEDLSKEQEQKLAKELESVSPLPKPNASLSAKRIFVGFGTDSITSIRLSQ